MIDVDPIAFVALGAYITVAVGLLMRDAHPDFEERSVRELLIRDH